MPKRKKQVIYPNDFDFGQLVQVNPKVLKGSKTLSRVRVDQSGNKYAELVVPLLEKIGEEF